MLRGITMAQLETNIALGRDHVAKQRAIIARLAEQDQPERLATERAVLDTIRGHLVAEIEMLAGMAPI